MKSSDKRVDAKKILVKADNADRYTGLENLGCLDANFSLKYAKDKKLAENIYRALFTKGGNDVLYICVNDKDAPLRLFKKALTAVLNLELCDEEQILWIKRFIKEAPDGFVFLSYPNRRNGGVDILDVKNL